MAMAMAMESAIRKVFPMLNYVLVKRIPGSPLTKGGIVVDENKMGRSVEGTVIELGPGSRHPQTGEYIKIDLEIGDRVLLPDYGGTRVKMADDNMEYLLFRESEILAKFQYD